MSVTTKFPISYAERAELGPDLIRFPATWEEYIDLREIAEYRVEFDQNEIITMSYASDPHEAIITNILVQLSLLFDPDPAIHIRGSGRPIFIREFGSEFNPDAHVIKGEPIFKTMRKGVNANTNPWLVVEIHSPSTRQRDWTEKLPKYKKIPSLQHILYIEQDRPFVSVFHRVNDSDVWENIDYDRLEQSLSVSGKEISLGKIYQKVVFPE